MLGLCFPVRWRWWCCTETETPIPAVRIDEHCVQDASSKLVVQYPGHVSMETGLEINHGSFWTTVSFYFCCSAATLLFSRNYIYSRRTLTISADICCYMKMESILCFIGFSTCVTKLALKCNSFDLWRYCRAQQLEDSSSIQPWLHSHLPLSGYFSSGGASIGSSLESLENSVDVLNTVWTINIHFVSSVTFISYRQYPTHYLQYGIVYKCVRVRVYITQIV